MKRDSKTAGNGLHTPATRRFFLTVATSMVTGPWVRAQSKSAPDFHGAVVGHGAFRYRVDKRWSQADHTQVPLKNCHEMVQAGDGRLFLLTDEARNNVLIYEVTGRLLGTWTLGLRGAHGLTLEKDAAGKEWLWLTDPGTGRVVKTDLEGRVMLELPTATACGAYQAGEDYRPTETAVAPNGDVYVADGYGSQFILRFDAQGKYLGKFGGKSTQPVNPGRFMQAHGVAMDLRGEKPLLVVTERVRNEFNWFTLEGEFVRGVYLPGAYVSRPVIAGRELYSGVCFGAKPDDYRMWQGRGFVTILDENDRVISNPGGEAPRYEEGRLKVLLQEAARPVFHNCHDVAVDTEGNLYVCQWNSGAVPPYKLWRES